MSLENLNETKIVKEKIHSSTPKTIGLEGPVSAGKTSIVKKLCENSDSFLGIKEYTDFLENKKIPKPSFPPSSTEEAKNNFLFFLQIEYFRKNTIKKNPSKNLILLDRSIFSLVAFEKGASYLTGIDIYNWALEKIVNERGKLAWPDRLIFLDIDETERTRRIKNNRLKTPNFIVGEVFNYGFKEAFYDFENMWPGLITFVNAKNTFCSVKNIVNKIILNFQ